MLIIKIVKMAKDMIAKGEKCQETRMHTVDRDPGAYSKEALYACPPP